jgi:spermidine synthase
MRFYEINPLVRPLAERWFTYLKDSGAEITFADGDGRASLRGEAANGFDVLVVDAFSGDAIPLHLLTVEAMQEYRRHLRPNDGASGGVIAFHVSNQYLDLAPEIAALAGAVGMEARVFDSGADAPRGEYRATWVLVSGEAGYFERGEMGVRGARIAPVAGVKAWTDDYSSLLPVVNWGGR